MITCTLQYMGRDGQTDNYSSTGASVAYALHNTIVAKNEANEGHAQLNPDISLEDLMEMYAEWNADTGDGARYSILFS